MNIPGHVATHVHTCRHTDAQSTQAGQAEAREATRDTRTNKEGGVGVAPSWDRGWDGRQGHGV